MNHKLAMALIFVASMCFVSCDGIKQSIFECKLERVCKKTDWLESAGKAMNEIEAIIKSNPQALDYELGNWEQEGCSIMKTVSSGDGNVRVYQVDVHGGFGMNPYYRWIVQFRDEEYDEVYVRHLESDGALLKEISRFWDEENIYHDLYLFIDNSDEYAQGTHYSERISSYALYVGEGEFKPVELFKAKKGYLSEISVSWEEFIYKDDKYLYSEENHIYCDGHEIFIPYVTQDLLNTETSLLYSWDWEEGRYVYRGVKPVAVFECDNFYTVRIDIQSDGSYKYTSWGERRSMEEKPDLVLRNGVKTCSEDDVVTYTFNNNTYTYIFEDRGYGEQYLRILYEGKDYFRKPAECIYY